MKKNILSLFTLLILTGTAKAQNNAGEPPKIIPPTPNAAALQKYGDIPVGAYTGIPSISIPLYEVSSSGIKVPISISYHASGIKVADEASRVGLGWALNAGGVITRNIMGQDDFDYNNFNYHSGNTSVPETVNDVAYDKGRAFNVQNGCTINSMPGSPNYAPYLADQHDFLPDQYSYNFMGYSGKFILKRNKQVVLLKKEKITITPLDNNATSWEIKTPEGTRYLFQEYEAYTDPNNGSQAARKSAWYLTKIISPTDEQVNFQYLVNTNNLVKPIGSFFESTNSNVFYYYPPGSPGSCPPNPATAFPDVRQESPRGEYRNVYLDKIVFKTGEVRFVYANDREDVFNDYRVSKIQIYGSSFNNALPFKLIKEWEFGYSYFVGSNDQDYTPTYFMATQVTKRLKLVSLTEKDGNGNSLPPHTFAYNSDEVTNTATLPAKTSFARDHWGYYNGKSSNSTLIPNYLPSLSNNPVAYYLGIMGNSRDTDPLFAQLFVLKQINYPTGGKTVFEYESNTFDMVNSNVNDHSFYNTYPEGLQKTFQKIYPGNIAGDQPTGGNQAGYVIDMTTMYTDPSTSSTQVSLSAVFIFNTSQSTCGLPAYYGKFSMTLMTESGSILAGPTDPFAFLAPNNPTLTTCNGTTGSYYGMTFANNYNLAPGKYVWRLHIEPGAENLFSNVSLTVNYLANKTLHGITYEGKTIKQADYAGGLRIKRISTYESTNATPKVKRYEYHNRVINGSDTSYYSFGKRMSRPIYSYVEKSGTKRTCPQSGGGSITTEALNQHILRESESNFPLNGSAGGGVVGYDKVVELLGENGEYGKTEYMYENVPDIMFDYSVSDNFGTLGIQIMPGKPPVMANVPNEGNGNLLTQTDFEYKNGSFAKVKELTNSYTEYRPTTPLWWGIDKRPWKGSWAAQSNCNITNYIYPALVESRKLLTSSVAKVYDNNNNTSYVASTTTYSYDLSTHLQLISTSQSTSNGESITTDITYPLDYADANSDNAIMTMKTTRHIHSTPITKRYRLIKADGTTQLLTGGEINKFQVINGRVLPLEVALFETATSVAPNSVPAYVPSSGSYPSGFFARLKFEAFDARGNITQVRKTDDVQRAYIWDDSASLPVAEVMNATAITIAYTSFEADGLGNWTITDPTRVEEGITGDRSFNLNSSNNIVYMNSGSNADFMISYWSRNGQVTISGVTSLGTKTGLTKNGWTYYEHKVRTTGTNITLTASSAIVLDELRLHPVNALMTTYTYDPVYGITGQCTPNNIISYYNYDSFGRLRFIRDMDGNILKTYEYKYKQ